MNKLHFVPFSSPYADFLILAPDRTDLRPKLLQLGAVPWDREGFTAYTWNPRLGSRFFQGLGVIDGKFRCGPFPVHAMPQSLGAGTYALVDVKHDSAHVSTDPFGMCPLYYAGDLVTNRLHLAAMTKGRIDTNNTLSCFYNEGGFAFNSNTFRTPVEGVKILPASFDITVTSRGVAARESFSFGESDEELEPVQYWDLIHRGANEIVDNVTAIVDAGLPVFSDITGGRDSRVVLGALVAAGRQADVIFNTIANPTTPGLQRDLDIGTGLVKHYGGSYSRHNEVLGYSHFTVDQHMMRRRSQVFGTYHWIVPSDVRPLSELTSSPTIRLLGGGGELYDDRFRDMVFTSVDIGEEYSTAALRSMLRQHVRSGIGEDLFECYENDLLETFESLPGRTLTHRINAHFLNFRNRFHFGPKQSRPELMYSVNPALSVNLVRAARGLPAAERAKSRVVFDVTQALDDELAHMPYDTATKKGITESPYYRPSRFKEGELYLEPAREIVHGENRRYKPFYPSRPIVAAPDFDLVLEGQIDEAWEELISTGSIFHHVMGNSMKEHADWARSFNITQKSALASKLRAMADFNQIREH